jgi:peptide deformylase
MSVQPITLLGNPILRQRCKPVKDFGAQSTGQIIADLRDTLDDFRNRKGFGRGIAAPQIGHSIQIIYLNFDLFAGPLLNPTIVSRSKAMFQLWDDCFSFPDLLVAVKRHLRIEVSYRDEAGTKRVLKAEGALSELLQHEIDHLHGVLAVDRAIDSKHIILKSEFEALKRSKHNVL